MSKFSKQLDDKTSEATHVSNKIESSPKKSYSRASQKVKFKNVLDFKKDVIIRKLLKTIDLMNQELSKELRIFLKNVKFKFEI